MTATELYTRFGNNLCKLSSELEKIGYKVTEINNFRKTIYVSRLDFEYGFTSKMLYQFCELSDSSIYFDTMIQKYIEVIKDKGYV